MTTTDVDIPRLITTRSDRELADDLRRRLVESFGPVIEVMEEASHYGLNVGFSINRDGFGRFRLSDIAIVKPL